MGTRTRIRKGTVALLAAPYLILVTDLLLSLLRDSDLPL
jgi:hypothetical protein